MARYEHTDVDVVLCGGTYRDDSGVYQPTTFEHSDEFGLLGGAIRATAAVARVLEGRTDRLLISGGKSKKGDALRGGAHVPAPPAAVVYRDAFLLELGRSARELGTDPPNPEVLLDIKTPNTNANLVSALQLADREDWRKMGIITNNYHLGRVEAICDIIREKLCLEHIKPEFIGAEAVAMSSFPDQYDGEVETAYAGEAGQLRLASETRGLADIRAGRYNFHEVRAHEL